MRGGNGANPRQAWLDRNPLTIVKAYIASGVAPHATTVRWSYTVPAARKAQLEMAMVELLRDSVAAPVGIAGDVVRITPSGGSVTNIIRCDHLNNTVGALNIFGLGGAVTLFPGDLIEGVSSDGSTGGTLVIVNTGKLTEFDA